MENQTRERDINLVEMEGTVKAGGGETAAEEVAAEPEEARVGAVEGRIGVRGIAAETAMEGPVEKGDAEDGGAVEEAAVDRS